MFIEAKKLLTSEVITGAFQGLAMLSLTCVGLIQSVCITLVVCERAVNDNLCDKELSDRIGKRLPDSVRALTTEKMLSYGTILFSVGATYSATWIFARCSLMGFSQAYKYAKIALKS